MAVLMSAPDTYPPFSGDDPCCVKCGGHGASTEWKPPEVIYAVVVREERFQRRCLRCSYRWTESIALPVVTDE